MNKALEALDRLKNFINKRDFYVNFGGDCEKEYHYKHFNEMFPNEFKIIEATLKENQERIEELEETNHAMFIREYKNTKKLKVLEIIKEKRVDITTLFDCRNAEEYNRWVDIRSHYSYRPFKLTQEEYDLLREILK